MGIYKKICLLHAHLKTNMVDPQTVKNKKTTTTTTTTSTTTTTNNDNNGNKNNSNNGDNSNGSGGAHRRRRGAARLSPPLHAALGPGTAGRGRGRRQHGGASGHNLPIGRVQVHGPPRAAGLAGTRQARSPSKREASPLAHGGAHQGEGPRPLPVARPRTLVKGARDGQTHGDKTGPPRPRRRRRRVERHFPSLAHERRQARAGAKGPLLG